MGREGGKDKIVKVAAARLRQRSAAVGEARFLPVQQQQEQQQQQHHSNSSSRPLFVLPAFSRSSSSSIISIGKRAAAAFDPHL
ncbi:hypothetical protein Emag_007271 [Eimeria magna]